MALAYNKVIKACLGDFERWLVESSCRKKEHDCVNAFSHGFLMQRALAEIAGFSPACIGIEIAVPQPDGWGTRPSVRRDLVIWPAPFSTTWSADWSAVAVPAVIVEWKARREGRACELDQNDLHWLTAMTEQHRELTGLPSRSMSLSIGPDSLLQRFREGRSLGTSITRRKFPNKLLEAADVRRARVNPQMD